MTESGLLNVFKPPGMTSHDVVYYLRKKLGPRKIGHGGTLDPIACGVLVCLVNKATKLSDQVVKSKKTYRAVALFGVKTDTGDAEGKVIETASVAVSEEEINAVLPRFMGDIEQIPPMTSARKIGGKKLYQLARQGIVIERPAKTVHVHSFKLVRMLEDEGPGPRALFEIECSGGTYVRTLVEDIGSAMSVPATTAFLLRSAVGQFELEQSIVPQDITPENAPGLLVLPEEVA